MDFEQFKENLTKDVKACFDDRTGADSSVETHKVDKMNYSYEAMVVKPEGSDVGVSIDVNNLYEAYQNGTSYEQIVAGATESAEHYLNDKPDFNIDALKDYSQMKDKLSMDVVSSERNAELLEKVPHKNIEDMAVVYRFVLDDVKGSVLVTNQMLENYNVTPEQLHADAMEVAPEIRPAVIKGMSEVLAESLGVEQAEMLGIGPVPDEPIFVASVEDNIRGTGILAYQDFMDQAADRLGGELLGLVWSDINFEERTLSVTRTMNDRPDGDGICKKRIQTPKAKASIRDIPMISEVIDAFLREYELQKCLGFCEEEIDGVSGFIFSNSAHMVYTDSAINRALHQIVDDYNEQETENAKKENRDPLFLPYFSCHILRHTFCSRLCESEPNPKIAQEIMGHSDIQTTLNIYADIDKSVKKKSVFNLDGKIIF